MNAIDTNVLLYSIDRNEPVKQAKAQQLLRQLRAAAEPTVLLWQVLGELSQQLRRWRDQGRLTPSEFAQHITAFRCWRFRQPMCSTMH
jgi:predicted nucleic acid-binding protein